MAEQGVPTPSNTIANPPSHAITQTHSNSSQASSSAVRTATSTTHPAPITPPNPITPDSILFQRIVEILSTTANGCIFELGYPQLCEKLGALEHDHANLQNLNSKLRAENQKLVVALQQEKQGVKNLREECVSLRREIYLLRSNIPEAYRELEAKYKFTLDLLKQRGLGQESPLWPSGSQQGHIVQQTTASPGPRPNVIPSQEYPLNFPSAYAAPLPPAGPPHPPVVTHPQEALPAQHPQQLAQHPGVGYSHSQPVIPAKRPLSSPNLAISSSDTSLPVSSSRNASRHASMKTTLTATSPTPILAVNTNMISPVNSSSPVSASPNPGFTHSGPGGFAFGPMSERRLTENGAIDDARGVVTGPNPLHSPNAMSVPSHHQRPHTADAGMKAPAIEPRWVGPQPQRPEQYPAPSLDEIKNLEAAARATKALDQMKPRSAGVFQIQPVSSGPRSGRRSSEASTPGSRSSNPGMIPPSGAAGQESPPTYPVSISGGEQLDIPSFQRSIRNALEGRQVPPIATDQHVLTASLDVPSRVTPISTIQVQSPQIARPSVPPSTSFPENSVSGSDRRRAPETTTEPPGNVLAETIASDIASARVHSAENPISPTEIQSIQSRPMTAGGTVTAEREETVAPMPVTLMEVDNVVTVVNEPTTDATQIAELHHATDEPARASVEDTCAVTGPGVPEEQPFRQTEISLPPLDVVSVQHLNGDTIVSESTEREQNIDNVTGEQEEAEEAEEDWSDLTDDEDQSDAVKRSVVDCISSIFYDDDEDERRCQLCNLRIQALNLTNESPSTFSESGMRDLIVHAKNEHPVAWDKLRKGGNGTPI